MKTPYLYLIVFIAYVAKGWLLFDPDTGWHLAMGQIILEKGIQPTDPFSYAMPSFPFVDHEWLFNILIYSIYPYGGFLILSVIFSAVVILLLWLIFGKLEKPGSLTIFFLTNSVLYSVFGMRVQILSWLFIALLLKFLLNEKIYIKYKKFLPLAILIWVNLHGSFAIGVALIVLFQVVRIFLRKFNFYDLVVTLLSIGATFINPYQGRMWEEVFRVLFDPYLRSEIAEWGLGVTFFDVPFWALVLISILLIFYDLKLNKKKFWQQLQQLPSPEKTTLVFFSVLLARALATYRDIPFWAIFASGLSLDYLGRFVNKFKKDKFATKTIFQMLKASAYLAAFFFVLEIGVNLYSSSLASLDNYYPQKGVRYLKANLPEGEIFSIYGWGGYLDWKLPEKKVFIDGRMPSMRWDAPKGESNWALADYINIVWGIDWDGYFSKYNIKTVIWPVYKKPNVLTKIHDRIMDKINGFFGADIEDPSTTFADRLERSGWKRVYQDENAVILKKN